MPVVVVLVEWGFAEKNSCQALVVRRSHSAAEYLFSAAQELDADAHRSCLGDPASLLLLLPQQT